ncbi:suppressor of fused domain protein [Spirillospora sp. NPDC047279]|uniref:suppressor of fused domain protein n=1 Tax=Spirillospora sp. NPDC047279 TaxID=3155478 RepID=UPI0033ED095B
MATHAQLVQVFGEEGVHKLDRDDAEANGVRPEDVEVLCSTGLPVDADIFFTMKVNGPLEAFTLMDAQSQDGPVRFLILGKGRTDDDVRYVMEVESGNVFVLGMEGGVPTGDLETINSTLDAFVEFLYRIELRQSEMSGSSPDEARPYTEKMIAGLKTWDARALDSENFWGGVFEAFLGVGVPERREGSRMAIAAALEACVPDDEPLRWATGAQIAEGVRELSAHRADGYWLLVTYGFSDLDDDLDVQDGVSGLGFELTMRVPRADDDELPPGWALETLRKLGEYVFGEGYPFADGHRMGVAGSLGASESRLNALAFITDPHLGTIDTPNGRVEFITAVGVTREELAEAKATSNDAVLSRLTGSHGVPLTDVTR